MKKQTKKKTVTTKKMKPRKKTAPQRQALHGGRPVLHRGDVLNSLHYEIENLFVEYGQLRAFHHAAIEVIEQFPEVQEALEKKLAPPEEENTEG